LTGLAAKDVLLAAQAKADLAALDASKEKEAQSIAKRARALRAVLLADCLHGEVVKKERIPKEIRELPVDNLYVEDLPGFWRFLYTISRDRGERYIVVVRIVDHETYSKWFPGRRR
jgi:hypothetical protein